MRPIVLAGVGTGFTCLMTAAGAAVVFLVANRVHPALQRVFLGFAAGVMVAASVWSLLLPSISMAQEQGAVGWWPAAGGVWLGTLFLLGLDAVLLHLPAGGQLQTAARRRTALLVLAVTLHNVPEGMAVGLACALAAQGTANVTLSGAGVLALGIGLQNFPEGAAIALPLRQAGFSRSKSFALGALSGVVEPLGGLLAVLAAAYIAPLMPWLLGFAAGAMLYVAAQELIPQASPDDDAHIGTMGVLMGFVLMMVLDVALS